MKKLFSVLILCLLALLMGLSFASAQVAEMPYGFSLPTLSDSTLKEGTYIIPETFFYASVIDLENHCYDLMPTYNPNTQDQALEKRLNEALKRIEELERLLKQHLDKP